MTKDAFKERERALEVESFHRVDTKPSPELAPTWKHYVRATTAKMSDEARRALRSDFVQRSRTGARASGGPMGFGVVSFEENRIIAKLEKAFDG